MNLNTYFEVRGEIGSMTYGYQLSVENRIDEDFDEYQSRVHRAVDEVFGRIKASENKRSV